MSGLIKAGAAQSIRPFAYRVEELPAAKSTEDPQLTALRLKIEALEQSVAQGPAALERAKREAKEAGKREALEGVRRDDEKQLAALKAALSAALQSWDARLAKIDGLAALLSKTALAKVFDDDAARTDLVLGTIARQMRHLRRETVLAVRVSPRDFPDAAALEAVAAQGGTGSASVVADPDLTAGDCRLDLQLGHVDIGPRTRWSELAALLDGFMAAEGEA
jgi:flagellar biosynthesis/type III secretory pathway protein FliH